MLETASYSQVSLIKLIKKTVFDYLFCYDLLITLGIFQTILLREKNGKCIVSAMLLYVCKHFCAE